MESVYFVNDFFDSLCSLRDKDKTRAIKTIQQIKLDPSNPGLKLHRIVESPDDNFWTARVTSDTRVVLYKKNNKVVLCHVNTHDEAYRWARRRRFNGDLNNLSFQLIDVEQEKIPIRTPPFLKKQEQVIIQPQSDKSEETILFKDFKDEVFEKHNFSKNEIDKIRTITDENEIFSLENILGEQKSNFLISLYLGEDTSKLNLDLAEENEGNIVQFEDTHEILSALEKPWEQWLVFLTKSQRKAVKKNVSGSCKIYGSAGTGKTVVALHRTKHLLKKHDYNNVGLFTFSRVLTTDLKEKIKLLLPDDEKLKTKLTVNYLEQEAMNVFSSEYGKRFQLKNEFTINQILISNFKNLNLESDFTEEFMLSEFHKVVGPWNLWEFKNYKNFQRLGRGNKLLPQQREKLSACFEKAKNEMNESGFITIYDLYHMASDILLNKNEKYQHIIIDEAQDLGPHMLRFVRSLTKKKNDDITLCGDTGQALYYRNHSYLRHGIDVRGKSSNLYINFRTSKEIKETSEKINELAIELEDNQKEVRKCISTFNGPNPEIKIYQSKEDELDGLLKWIIKQKENNIDLHEIIILARHKSDLKPVEQKLKENRLPFWELDALSNYHENEVGLAVVRRVKGLEYRSVAIISCDEDKFPSEDGHNLGDLSDDEDFLIKEANLFYVAITRARENLYISGKNPISEFVQEIQKV